MNRKILYGIVFIGIFLGLILPDILNPKKGFVFTFEEWTVLFSVILGTVLFRGISLKIIRKLNEKFSWKNAPKTRVLILLFFVLLGGVIFSSLVYLPTAFYIDQFGVPEFYREILLRKHEIKGGLPEDFNVFETVKRFDFLKVVIEVSTFCSLFIFGIEELAEYLGRQTRKKQKFQELLTEQAQLKANALKKQLDPHFLFNTLNVLSGLIHEDVNDSEKFIKEMSSVYRYVVEKSEELVTTVEDEFKFLDSYLYLLKIRFDDKISTEVHLPADREQWLVPSMTLELLVENAIKHNTIETDKPLSLSFSVENDQLIVKNNLQVRKSNVDSTGVGLKNLKNRMELLGLKGYDFSIIENEFVAIIPLINPENV